VLLYRAQHGLFVFLPLVPVLRTLGGTTQRQSMIKGQQQ
jgi:hypothetical protein